MSYLNTRPLLYGIRQHEVMNEIELVEDYPASIASMLIKGEVDMGLIPVAATLRMDQWEIIGNYCIGCEGPVASVCIFSEVPIEEVHTVYLDYQSRTSVTLARVLMKEYWKKEVEFVDARGEDYRSLIRGGVAGVVIGDRALQQRLISPYIYDLGETWIAHTGLPFVFAAWIARQPLDAGFVQRFDAANSLGLAHLDEVAAQNAIDYYDLGIYYKQNISYQLTDRKREGLRLFLKKAKEVLG